MKKKGFTIVELCVIFCVILGLCFLILPKGIESTQKVKLVSKWEQKYYEIQYVFSDIKLQLDEQGSVSRKQYNDILKKDFRIIKLLDKIYEPRFKTQKTISDDSIYNIDKYYLTSSNEIIGFKWSNYNCKNKDLCALITFDLNGLEAPNIYGEDIFGINVDKDKISALGEGSETNLLRQNCKSIGIYCSYYYLIGGNFE